MAYPHTNNLGEAKAHLEHILLHFLLPKNKIFTHAEIISQANLDVLKKMLPVYTYYHSAQLMADIRLTMQRFQREGKLRQLGLSAEWPYSSKYQWEPGQQHTCSSTKSDNVHQDKKHARSWSVDDDIHLWTKLGHFPRTSTGKLKSNKSSDNSVTQLANHFERTHAAIKSRLKALQDPNHKAHLRLHSKLEIAGGGYHCLKSQSSVTTKKPAEPPSIITFGKYRGKTFEEISQSDAVYCAWILSQLPTSKNFQMFRDYLVRKLAH